MDLSPNEQLAGSVALVTGASCGIGAAVAAALAAHGAHVVLAAGDDAGLVATDDAIRAAGGEATLLPADLTRADVTDAIGANIFERFGRLDVLVDAALVRSAEVPVAQIKDEDWDKVIGLGATATWRLIRTTEPLLRAARHGRVVMVTHGVATTPRVGWSAFAAAMAARQALVKSWSRELESSPLRVNLVQTDDHITSDKAAEIIVSLCMPGETRHGALVTPD